MPEALVQFVNGESLSIFSPVGLIKKLYFSLLWAPNLSSKPFIFFIWPQLAKMLNFWS